MPNFSRISKIIDDVFSSLPPQVSAGYSISSLVSEIEEKLTANGDLVQTAIGKVETRQGREHGIVGNATGENTAAVWELQCTFAGIEYIKSVLHSMYPEFQSIPTVADYKYSRRYYRAVCEECPSQIILLESPDKYWTYYESAEKLAQILDTEIHKNANGEAGLAFAKTELNKITYFLKTKNIGWYVEGPSFTDEYIAEIVDPQTVSIILGSKFVIVENGVEEKCILTNSDQSIPVWITRTDGTIEQILVTQTEIDGYKVITDGSSLGQLLIHRTIGESIMYNDSTYQIKEIIA